MEEATHPPDLGATAPDFTVADAHARATRLAELCAERPLVLSFYRGHW